MIRIRDIKLPIGHTPSDMMDTIASLMCLDKIYPGNSYPDLSFEVLRKSIDARKKPDIFFVYTVRILISGQEEEKILAYYRKNGSDRKIKKALEKILTDPMEEYVIPECGSEALPDRPVVVGTGPCGLFAALLLARRGFRPVVIERGERVDDRSKSVEKYFTDGVLNTESNVQFGEGGAGTFSDGKLNTLTKDVNGRNSFVIRTFAEHGAPKEIVYDAKPHIGTDVLRNVVANIREEIISLGGKVLFNTKLTDITVMDGNITGITVADTLSGKERSIPTRVCVIAPGHSARDTFEMLFCKGIRMEQKNFAVGFRIIHPQDTVDKWQYGKPSNDLGLPAADYKVTNETSKGRRVYSFCMCPGGYVVNASSEDDMVCVNGMSEHNRDSGYANSAIIAAVTPDDFQQDMVKSDHPLAGMYFQRNIEKKAFERANGAVPVQKYVDFRDGRVSTDTGYAKEAVKGKTVPADLRGIYPGDIDEAIIESVNKFGYTREEFDSDSVIMCGVESRTSSPVRISRDENYESNIKGLYPCGEGAGYAGGITSAAADGIRCAEMIIRRYNTESINGSKDE